MIEMVVARLAVDAATHNYVVILQERDGERVLPIWIGQPEAESIIIEMHHIPRARPLTHDLCRSLIRSLGAELERVEITRIEERTYFAELQFLRGGERVRVDARPSDSIAIALRVQAPIFAAEALLVDDAQSWDPAQAPSDPAAEGLSAERLKAYLERLRPEDFGKFNP
ncbi:MAG TPA: bifunctional nuclease family protein [Gemmatimonadaceae bacterium]|nr:bifunctional nuclease family protein [Gemmatimonadaceae bacterium]